MILVCLIILGVCALLGPFAYFLLFVCLCLAVVAMLESHGDE